MLISLRRSSIFTSTSLTVDRRFSEQSSALFLLSSCLSPQNSFQAFDKENLIEYARLYPSEFSDNAIAALDLQLTAFIMDVRSDARFREMNALNDLFVQMVETGKNTVYPLVYLLLCFEVHRRHDDERTLQPVDQ